MDRMLAIAVVWTGLGISAVAPAWAQDAGCQPLFDAAREAQTQPGIERTAVLGDPAKPSMTMTARKTAGGWFMRRGTGAWQPCPSIRKCRNAACSTTAAPSANAWPAPPSRSPASRRGPGPTRRRACPRRSGLTAWHGACRSRCRPRARCRPRSTRRRRFRTVDGVGRAGRTEDTRCEPRRRML